MKAFKYVFVFILVLGLTVPALAEKPETPDIPDTGELYGDLYVILRDENGVPMLSGDGCIQPISSVDGSVSIETNGEPLDIQVYAGEPFALPTYTDSAGDLVECELTEDMATWVQSVDFGRLNLGRAPDAVINHAFDEAITKLNDATAITIDPPGRLVLTLSDGEIKTIDSPAENLSLYIKMMIDGHWITTDTTTTVKGNRPEGKGPTEGDGPSTEPRPVINDSAIDLLEGLGYTNLGLETMTNADLDSHHLTLAASLFAAAADKFGSINLDKVMYINSVYGINQAGSLPGEIEGKTYFDFGGFGYGRNDVYGSRGSAECTSFGSSWIWVLQPDLDGSGVEIPFHFEAQCMDILGYDPVTNPTYNAVHFIDMVEEYWTMPEVTYDFIDNVRGFAQAADDALQVLEYYHNYKVPEVLYP